MTKKQRWARDHGRWKSVTVSYRRVDVPLFTSHVGYGKTMDDALRDADSQLSDGTWTRIVVSNPQTILTDMRGNSRYRNLRSRNLQGEGVTIKVEKRISEVINVE